MMPPEIAYQLKRLALADDFPARSAELVELWVSVNVGFEAVGPILQFMEENPSVAFGMPGALVHFAEKFDENAYEESLLASISRRPTQHTIWMLNRAINGTKMPTARERLIEAMVNAKSNPLIDTNTLNQIGRFLQRLGVNQ